MLTSKKEGKSQITKKTNNQQNSKMLQLLPAVSVIDMARQEINLAK